MTAPRAAPGGGDAVLQATSLYRFFRAGDTETLALQGVSLSIAAGEIVAVTGPSGSGKSTLLSCLAGTDNPDGGMVRINGRRISHQPEHVQARIRAANIGLLFQTANLLPHLTVAQNITLSQRLLGRRGRRVTQILHALGIEHRCHAYPDQLSGGELARAGLAVAIANDPPVILADEPTGELDSATEYVVLNLLKDRAQRGAAIVLASHSTAVAATAHRLLRLSDGRVQ
jgi:putative ABC transport system ATP-binding protein